MRVGDVVIIWKTQNRLVFMDPFGDGVQILCQKVTRLQNRIIQWTFEEVLFDVALVIVVERLA